jgi:hypothetical protein
LDGGDGLFLEGAEGAVAPMAVEEGGRFHGGGMLPWGGKRHPLRGVPGGRPHPGAKGK